MNKYRGPVLLSVVVATFLIAAFLPKKTLTPDDRDSLLMRTVLGYLSQLHYQPLTVDDKLSEKFYDMYLTRLDWGKRFLTQQEVDQLETYKFNLDDETKKGSYEFFELSVDLITKGINRAEGYYKTFLEKPVDLNSKANYEMDAEKRSFAKDEAALKDLWEKYLTYEIISRLNDKLEAQEKVTVAEEKKTKEQLEEEARKDVVKSFNSWFDRMKKLDRQDRLSYYISSLAAVFDPHSEYMAPQDREDFNVNFYGRLEGIGARLMTDGDYTKVSEVVVGGPAWNGKELKKDDAIVKVAQGDEDPVDVVGWQVDEVVKLIRGKKGTEVKLTVKRIDGTQKVISIIRDIVYFEDSFAKSLILDGEKEGEKIGYIYLPRFYEDFDNDEGHFCSKDVAKEIEKLKNEKVDGIILDLRNNPGGGLRESVNMSGLFFDEGPVVQIKGREGRAQILSDKDASVQYNGPLVVMVNNNSASASEIVAGNLQDYGRAVIVGSKSTFGKGTVQRLYQMDRNMPESEEKLGDIRLTVQKFYRINGGSNQLKGVVPDIILPDVYSYVESGEAEELYPLSWSEIEPAPYEVKGPLNAKAINSLKKKSLERVSKNEAFKTIEENAKWLKAQRDQSLYPLSLEAYQALEAKRNEESEHFNKAYDQFMLKGVKNVREDLARIELSESTKARNDDWIKNVSKDIYLKETVSIMHDLLKVHQ